MHVVPRTGVARVIGSIPSIIAVVVIPGLSPDSVIVSLIFSDLLIDLVHGSLLVSPTVMIACFSSLPSYRGYHDSSEKYRSDFHNLFLNFKLSACIDILRCHSFPILHFFHQNILLKEATGAVFWCLLSYPSVELYAWKFPPQAISS